MTSAAAAAALAGDLDLPLYCCVILNRRQHSDSSSDANPLVYLEERGDEATVAANHLTCFGGKRDFLEPAEDCIRRECREEMGWAPVTLDRVTDLYVDDRLVAWFYVAEGPTPAETATMAFETGRTGVWVAPTDPRISPWHRTVLDCWQRGQARSAHTSSPHEKNGVHRYLDALAIHAARLAAEANAAAAT